MSISQGFAAPDAAPHIQPLHRTLRRRFAALAQQTAELAAQPARRRARRGLLQQSLINAIQLGDGPALNLIGLIFPCVQRLLVAR